MFLMIHDFHLYLVLFFFIFGNLWCFNPNQSPSQTIMLIFVSDIFSLIFVLSCLLYRLKSFWLEIRDRCSYSPILLNFLIKTVEISLADASFLCDPISGNGRAIVLNLILKLFKHSNLWLLRIFSNVFRVIWFFVNSSCLGNQRHLVLRLV